MDEDDWEAAEDAGAGVWNQQDASALGQLRQQQQQPRTQTWQENDEERPPPR